MLDNIDTNSKMHASLLATALNEINSNNNNKVTQCKCFSFTTIKEYDKEKCDNLLVIEYNYCNIEENN